MFRKIYVFLFGRFAKEKAPSTKEKNVIHTFKVETLEDIMTILHKDYFESGYKAALRLADKNYAQLVLDGIKGEYLGYVHTVIMAYTQKKNRLLHMKKMHEEMGMMDKAKELQSNIEVKEFELSKLEIIQKEIEEEKENGYFEKVKKTFWVGFNKGMVDVMTAGKINGFEYENAKSEKTGLQADNKSNN